MERRSIVWLTLALALLVLAGGWAVPPARATGALSGEKICLDPGHGGSDPGAVYEDSELRFVLHESEINLDVSFALKALLEADGAEVVMTRTEDVYKANRDRYTFCNSQGATLLVSVHTNSTTDSSMDGSMGLYFHEDDRKLAQAIHEVMYPFLLTNAPVKDAFRDFGLSRFASGVLLKSDMPAAMMEPLFMSNDAEAELLQDTIPDECADLNCRRGEIVRALRAGILHYFDSGSPTPTPAPTPEPGGTLHVAAINMSYEQKGPNVFVSTGVTIVDGDGNRVSGATVSLETTQPDGNVVSDIGTTGDQGIATFKLKSNQTGTYTSTVTAVGKDGWEYVPPDDGEPSATLTVP
jgi:N-acetylmuramoyl-L-alanine amidase